MSKVIAAWNRLMPVPDSSDSDSHSSALVLECILRSAKVLPPSLDLFGWCTWDAFYSSVSAQGIQVGRHHAKCVLRTRRNSVYDVLTIKGHELVFGAACVSIQLNWCYGWLAVHAAFQNVFLTMT